MSELCRACRGSKVAVAMIDYAGRGGVHRERCPWCRGSGVDREPTPQEAAGGLLHNMQRAHQLTTAAAARVCGVSMTEYCQARRGEIDPQPFIDALKNHTSAKEAN